MTAADALNAAQRGAAPGGSGEPTLKRRLGVGLLTLYGVGVMVGAGIYVLVGEVAAEAGRYAPLSFLLAGIAAAFSAASFAELSARMPESAGEAAYALKAFGSKSLSLLVGFAVMVVGVLAAGVVLQGGVGYLTALVPLPREALIIAVGVLLTVAAVVGVVESLALAATLTVIEVVGLLVIVAAGLSAPALDAASPSVPATGGEVGAMVGVLGGVFLAFFAFLGFEDMVNMAEETRRPERTVPLAILLAVILVTALYLAVSYAAVRVVAPERLAASRQPLALVFETATGRSSHFISAIAVAAALNGILAQIVMAARVAFGLGRRTAALGWLHESHPRFGTPVRATLLMGVVVIVLSLSAPLSDLASSASMGLLGVFILMNLALIRLKRRGPPPEGAPNIPAWAPWSGAILSSAVLLASFWSAAS